MRKCHWIFNLPAGFHAELNGCEAAAPPLFVFWDDHQRILGPIAFLACSNYPRIRHKKKELVKWCMKNAFRLTKISE